MFKDTRSVRAPQRAAPRYVGSGWFRPLGDGYFRACDTCGRFAVTVNDPREDQSWPLIRCRQCRKSDARLPTAYAETVTIRMRQAVFEAALDAADRAKELWGRSLFGSDEEVVMLFAKVARDVLRAKHREEQGE